VTLAAPEPRSATLRGHSAPRVAPPIPAKSLLKEYEAAAKELGIKLMPWQRITARYMTALGRNRWGYREVVVVVARQNGKTELLVPRILMGLRLGENILHTAQNRDLPRQTFLRVARLVAGLPEIESIRKANGQEEIVATNGARYKLVAPNSNVRGQTADLVLLDEVREQHDQDVMDAILPTITARKNPQVIYLSNAGDDESIVLNDLRRRMDHDPRLAYLEWSAAPDRPLDDREGWAEANPGLGHTITLDTLEYNYLNRPPASFETEHLCRWVVTMRPKLVPDLAWLRCRGPVEPSRRPMMGISMDATGTRASAVLAWRQSDGSIALRVAADVTGNPIDTSLLGPELRQLALRAGVARVGFDPWDTADLARHFTNAKPLVGRDFAAASQTFAQVVEVGRLRWEDADQVTADLAWAARKQHENGAWEAIKANEDRPVPAAFAAIRAVWLTTDRQPAIPKVM
jgi:phage terminase large subunit-like protein